MRDWLVNRVTVTFGLIAAVAAAMLFRIQVDTDPENMLPPEQPDRVECLADHRHHAGGTRRRVGDCLAERSPSGAGVKMMLVRDGRNGGRLE